MTRMAFVVVMMFVAVAMTASAQAGVLTAPNAPAGTLFADQTFADDGATTWVGQPSAAIGKGPSNTSHRESAHILSFVLPDLGVEVIQTANLKLHAADSPWGPSLSLDLYGVRWSNVSSVAIYPGDFYRGPWDISGTNGAPLQQAFATKTQGNPAPLNERNVETDAVGDAALAAWLASVYTAGAVAGDFVFIRVNPDADLTSGSNSYIYFDTADTVAPNTNYGMTYVLNPELTITTGIPPAPPIPEPAGLGLVGLALLALKRRRS